MRILGVFAHPDDECFCAGGTFAYYADSGAEIMVVSATPGDAGEINDSYLVTRKTLGATRVGELKAACATLGIQHVVCWNYPDGGLYTTDREQLVEDIVAVLLDFRPNVVITFGPDGGYGHPDHIAISHATRQAVESVLGDEDLSYEPCLYFAHFPKREMLLLEELSTWLMMQDEEFRGSLDFVKALSIFAKESTMLHFSNDFVETRWFAPGFCIVEQGETSDKLYIILSGTVDVMKEDEAGNLTHVNQMGMGQFFGEIGIAKQQTRSAYVIAKMPTTCLIFANKKPTLFAGRGRAAKNASTLYKTGHVDTRGATHVISLLQYIQHKMTAIGKHRTQFPIEPDMFPTTMLERVFGHEYFVQIYPQLTLQTSL